MFVIFMFVNSLFPSFELLRLKIKRRFAAFHIERYRAMLVRDHPLAVNLAEANGRAPPHLDFPSVYRRSLDLVEAVAEGHVIARSDAQVPNLVTE
jgi:hypothetical protein